MTHFRITSSLILSFCLTACNFNPFYPDNLSGGETGAGAAVVGAAAGIGVASWYGAPKSIAALAGVGGAGAGYYFTTLSFASGGVIKAGGVVYTLGEYATIEIPTDKLFDTNSAEFLPETGPILDSTVAVLNRYPKNNIMVSGNTSGFGTTQWEHTLSEERAAQVAHYLTDHGITGFQKRSICLRKLTYVGYGNYFPISNNIRAQSIRENSRIQITAYPSTADLHLDKRHEVFHNIGGLEEPMLPNKPPQPNLKNEFSGDQLPDKSSTRADDFNDVISDVKGETWENQSTVSSASQTAAGNKVVKQGGFKGEGG